MHNMISVEADIAAVERGRTRKPWDPSRRQCYETCQTHEESDLAKITELASVELGVSSQITLPLMGRRSEIKTHIKRDNAFWS